MKAELEAAQALFNGQRMKKWKQFTNQLLTVMVNLLLRNSTVGVRVRLMMRMHMY